MVNPGDGKIGEQREEELEAMENEWKSALRTYEKSMQHWSPLAFQVRSIWIKPGKFVTELRCCSTLDSVLQDSLYHSSWLQLCRKMNHNVSVLE